MAKKATTAAGKKDKKDKKPVEPVVNVKTEARAIAETMPDNLGFVDPATLLTLITTLLPMLFKCFERSEEQKVAAMSKYATKHYNEQTGEYRKGLLNRTMARVHEAAETKKVGAGEIDDNQARRVAIATLDRARLNPKSVTALAAQMPAK